MMCTVLFVVCTLLSYGESQIIATSSTATSETYDTASINDFKNQNITCTKALCEIICDEGGGCSGTRIYGSLSNILQVICSNQYSCSYMKIIGGGQILTNITCNFEESCDSPIYNIPNSETVHLNCYKSINTTSTYAVCAVPTLNAGTSSNVYVYCGYRGCNNALTVHAESVSNGLYLNCDADYSCSGQNALVYCPENAGSICDITCSDSEHSCDGLSAFIKDKSALTDLNMHCKGGNSCYLTTIFCGSDTNSPKTTLANNVNSYGINPIQYSCGSSDCCPWTYCEPSEECIIDCETRKCDYSGIQIDGSMASKLTVNCNKTKGGGCKTATIRCPEGITASCSINCFDEGSCQTLQIYTAGKWFDCNGDCDDSFFYCNDAPSTQYHILERKNEYDGGSCPWLPTKAPTIMPTISPIPTATTTAIPTISPLIQTNDTFKWRINEIVIGLITLLTLLCFQ